MTEKIQEIIQRVVTGKGDEVDLQAIAAALWAEEVVLATGDRAIAIGGDANDSVNVTGNHNQVVVVKGIEAEVIARLLQQFSAVQTVSVNELLQQVRSQASTKILNLFSKIQLLNKRQVAVNQLYVDVYMLEVRDFRATIPGLLAGQDAGQDAREQLDRFGLGKRGERSPGLAIAASEDYPRLMVLGKPGSGKSTFLRHLAVSCARGEFLGDYIPVLLELRDVDEAAFTLFQCLHGEFRLEQEAQTEQILKQGRVLLLLDGLDEVPSSLRQTVQHELRKFAKRYDKNRFILTCRTQTTEYIPEQFQAVEVADFKPEQVECFALHWFTAMAGTSEQGMALKNHFMEKLRESPQTAELAVTPVLLSLTCWIFNDMKGLPQKRSDLYRDGLDLLLQQWDEGRGISRDSGSDRYQQLTTEERRRLLSYVAVRKFEQAENFVLFEESELCGYIAEHLQLSVEESRAVLGAIAQQHGLLIKRAQGIWSFSHLTFQEYLVAKWFCDRTDWQELSKHINKMHWQEIFLLAVEFLLDASPLLLEMKFQIDIIIAKDKKIQRFLEWVNQKALAIATPEQSAARTLYFARIPEVTEAVNYTLKGFVRALRQSIVQNSETDLDRALLIITLEDNSLSTIISTLGSAIKLAYKIDPKLEKALQHLRDQIPDSNHLLHLWQESEGEMWLQRLRKVMIQYRNIGHDWQFDDGQKRLLQRYFHANEILASCLSDCCCTASDKTKQEIRRSFLLPIAEIEKRKKQSSD